MLNNYTDIPSGETIEDQVEGDINVPTYLTFTIILFIIGFISNFFIILAVFCNKKLQTRGYAFTCNLAVSDFAVLVLSDFFIILGIATRGTIFTNNPHFCLISSYFCLALCITSIWTIAIGSFHSYVRVCHRLKYHRLFTKQWVHCSILSAWMIGLGLMVPSLIGWGGHKYHNVLRYCVFDYLKSESYTLFLVGFGVLIPLAIATYSFIRIMIDVVTSRRKLRQVNSRQTRSKELRLKAPPRINSRDARLLRSFLFVALYLASAWLFLMVIWVYGESARWTPRQVAYSMTAAHSHCSVNSILYAVTNKDFRESCLNILKCDRTRNQQATEQLQM